MRKRPILIGSVAALALALTALGAWGYRRLLPWPVSKLEAADEQPWNKSPYRNVQPEVRYVGDQVCADCHPAEADSFRKHPMGRSLQPVTRSTAGRSWGPAAHNPFASLGLEFRVDWQDGQLRQQARRLDRTGQVVTSQQTPVQYVVGSGRRGQTFLVQHEGFLFQAPISWYSRKAIWDLSPGNTEGFWLERPIIPACLFCHSNRVEPVAESINRYHEPIFQGWAIGCERCHGPGELHVQAREQGEVIGPDWTIINPRKLEPELREAVCQQCHLEGTVRVLRRGREVFDYRPGLPLDAFWSVFVAGSDTASERRAVGQVEQMYESKCFQASRGLLGCISCHDPHHYPREEERIGYNRGRCLQCHDQQGCSLTAQERLRQSPRDDCAACHMPPLPSTDVAHTALSDHRILRRPRPDMDEGRASGLDPVRSLVLFAGFHVPGSMQEADRDRGLALGQLGVKMPELSAAASRAAAALLRQGLEIWPGDLPALESWAQCRAVLGDPAGALALRQRVLELSPAREASVVAAASAAATLGKRDQALALWQRAVELDPWNAKYHDLLARALSGANHWPQAVREFDAALRLNPANVQTRLLLAGCLARLGQPERARKEFATVLQFDPSNKEALQRWFARQMP